MLQPLGKHVLISPIREETKMRVAALSKGQAEKGTIVSIGTACEIEGVEVGDVVTFRKYSPEEFDVYGQKVYLVEDVDLMGKWV